MADSTAIRFRSQSEQAVLCEHDPPADLRPIANLLAPLLEQAVADLVSRLPVDWGLLAQQVTPAIAERCVSMVTTVGVTARAIDQEDVTPPPAMMLLKRARVAATGLSFEVGGHPQLVPWDSLLLVDVAREMRGTKEFYEDLEESGDSNRRIHRLETKWSTPLVLDLVSLDPWMWLRLQSDTFGFASTGLPLQTNRVLNLYAIGVEVLRRSPQAEAGLGLSWVETGAPMTTPLPFSHRQAVGRLTWLLTCWRANGRIG